MNNSHGVCKYGKEIPIEFDSGCVFFRQKCAWPSLLTQKNGTKIFEIHFFDSFWRWQCKLFCIFWIVSHWIYWSFFKWQFRENWKLKLKTRPPNNQIEKKVCVLEHWHTLYARPLYENAFSTQSFWFNFRAITNTIPTISQKKARAHTLKFIEIDPNGFYSSGTRVFFVASGLVVCLLFDFHHETYMFLLLQLLPAFTQYWLFQ